jgi:hypothetical protein
MERLLREQFRAYRATLRDDHCQLLERFQPVDMARKVVGVGGVGTLDRRPGVYRSGYRLSHPRRGGPVRSLATSGS